MGQLTIYLPDEVERRVRRHARRAKKSVSAYLASLEAPELEREVDANGHPVDLVTLWGSAPDLRVVPDPQPEIPTLGTPLSPRHRRLRPVPQRR